VPVIVVQTVFKTCTGAATDYQDRSRVTAQEKGEKKPLSSAAWSLLFTGSHML